MAAFRNAKWLITLIGGSTGFAIFKFNQNEKASFSPGSTLDSKQTAKWDSNWDKCEYRSKSGTQYYSVQEGNCDSNQIKPKPISTRHLMLVRHGQYNTEEEYDSDMTLTDLGQEQALFTGQRLMGLKYDYTRIIHSTMTRARETSVIIKSFFPNVPMQRCELLEEGAPIPPDPPVDFWQPEPSQFFKDGTRLETAFRKYFHRADVSQEFDTYEILVCHANVIRYFLCRILQFPPEAWLRFTLSHASITYISILPDGTVTVSGVGECGHIPAIKLTFA